MDSTIRHMRTATRVGAQHWDRDREFLFHRQDGDATAGDFGDAMSKATYFCSISPTRPWLEKCREIQ
jgi:hypothetical protein